MECPLRVRPADQPLVGLFGPMARRLCVPRRLIEASFGILLRRNPGQENCLDLLLEEVELGWRIATLPPYLAHEFSAGRYCSARKPRVRCGQNNFAVPGPQVFLLSIEYSSEPVYKGATA